MSANVAKPKAVLTRPSSGPNASTYQSAPSGPTVIDSGSLVPVPGVGTSDSPPLVVIRPTSELAAVNHSAPSGPATICCGERPDVHSAESPVSATAGQVGQVVTVAPATLPHASIATTTPNALTSRPALRITARA